MEPVADASTTLTVVVPAWDDYAHLLLDEAIDSLRAQRPRPAILVVDNASTVPIAPRPGVEVLRTDRRLTVGMARNRGLERVTTPWAMLWDADDVMLPGTVSELLATARATPAAVVVASGIIDGATGRRHHWPRPWTTVLARAPRVYALVHAVSSLFPTTGALLRTDVVLDGGGFADTDGGDDWVVGLSLALRGRVVVHPRLGRVYRRHRGSLSADWTGTDDIVRHAALVRGRLAHDPAAPACVRAALPAVRLAQHVVIRVLRPLSRRLPGRRRELQPLPDLPVEPATATADAPRAAEARVTQAHADRR
ncbi:glycosyltransferase family 2 protein [Patulibacter sp. SYSU D01012]|uniref:glycosyltransferase family 2 protein n=1 Tax=Patulibacter sp. SYSU D01012 TaxID=2817381 RepID=UPI001B309E53|nr:glycosyltransferase family 2 protein [Patulibacter sp. SYSU D01012]